VEEALDRLDAGDYGICLACDEAIAEKRLLALPWARYCVTCQENAGWELEPYREPAGKG
jgi:DnaK suppressor protein